MSVNAKTYQAAFLQTNPNDAIGSDDMINRQVWFMIIESYGEYRIAMYYDNEYNRADGSDL